MSDATAPPFDQDIEAKKSIWQRWGRQQDWKQAVEEECVRKEFDIPKNDMQLHKTETTTTGASGGAIAATALAGGIPATVLAAMLGLSAMRAPQAVSAPAPTAVNAEAKADVGLYKMNTDGTYSLVDLPTLPANAKVK